MFKRVQFSSLLIVSLVVAMLAIPAICAAAPGLNITKTASPSTLTVAGPVRYTYVVWYEGQTYVTNFILTDNKLGVIPLPSTSDTSTPGYLYQGEIFTYNATATVSATTTNVATIAGRENNETTITASAAATVTYSPTRTTTTTVDGGHIPDTGSPWYSLLVLGIGLTLAGVAGVVVVSRRRHA